MLADLRYAFRNLRKVPGFTVLAVLTLALGIGANTAIFSVLHAVLLQPLPYADSGRLVNVWETFPMAGARGQGTLCVPRFAAWHKDNTAFEAFAMGEQRGLVLSQSGERLSAWQATADFFRVLGVTPLLGRTFNSGEDLPGKGKVAVLSHGAWQRRFGSDPNIVNRQISLREGVYTVIGVMPESFRYPIGANTELWIPMEYTRAHKDWHTMHTYMAIARLKPGITPERAQAEMETLTRHLEHELAAADQRSVRLIGMLDDQVSNVRQVIWLLFGAVSLVLIIACVNVSNLLLGRAAARRNEVAVRAALGAGRGRIIRQFLTESFVLASAGAVLAVVFAAWLIDLLKLVPYRVSRLDEAQLNLPVLAFTCVATVVAALLFGVLPAWQTSRLNLSDTLKDATRGSSSKGRTRSALVVAEVSLTIVLLVGATLLVRSLLRLQSIPVGFDTANLLTFRVPLVQSRYPDNATAAAFYQRLADKLRAMPGVKSAGAISRLPPSEWGTNGTFTIEGVQAFTESQRPFAEIRFVTPGYFETAGISLLKGRFFAEADRNPKCTCTMLLNDTFVKRYMSGMDPLGRKANEECTIVGVVADVKNGGLARATRPEVYLPMEHAGESWVQGNMNFIVRTSVEPMSLATAVRGAMKELDSEGRVMGLRSMEASIADGFSQPRFRTLLIGALAVLALLLALIGLYGVISYEVTQRTREIGIRMALGAKSTGVLGMIVGRGLRLTAAGIVVGSLASLTLTKIIRGYLYDLSPFDPVSFALVAALVIVVAAVAAIVPALRATRVDPTTALRYE